MGPKKARTQRNSPASAEELRSFGELWKAARTHGIDWALTKIAEGPTPPAEAPRDKRTRKAPARFREETGTPVLPPPTR